MKLVNGFIICLVLGVLLVSGCSGDGPPQGVVTKTDDTKPPPDTTPPAGITDLEVRLPWPGALGLIWTTPGDDDNMGTPAEFDIRYSDQPITEENWDSAIPVTDEPTPREVGARQSIRVHNLFSSRNYYFAMKTADEVQNLSVMSNVAIGATLPEDNPPAAVTDLRALAIGENTMMLTFTAAGDDGMDGQASVYDVRYRPSSFGAINWDPAPQFAVGRLPKPGGEPDTILVTGLDPQTNYRFAIKVGDESPNWSDESNTARELGYGIYLAVSKRQIVTGKKLKIHYRAEADREVSLGVYHAAAETCDRISSRIVELVRMRVEPGTYEYVFDFYDDENDQYYPPRIYRIMLCYEFETMAFELIILDPPE